MRRILTINHANPFAKRWRQSSYISIYEKFCRQLSIRKQSTTLLYLEKYFYYTEIGIIRSIMKNNNS